MFIVGTANQSYPYPVTVGLFDEKGKKQNRTFKVRFKRVSQEEIEMIEHRLKLAKRTMPLTEEELAEIPSKFAGAEPMTDMELLHEVVTGFEEGVFDKDGNPLPFNAENLEELANTFPAKPAMVNAFFDSINKVMQKN